MDEYTAQTTRLWAYDPAYGWADRNGMNEQAPHRAEMEGRQLCTFIIAGFPPGKAYAAAYPQVEETGTKAGWTPRVDVSRETCSALQQDEGGLPSATASLGA